MWAAKLSSMSTPTPACPSGSTSRAVARDGIQERSGEEKHSCLCYLLSPSHLDPFLSGRWCKALTTATSSSRLHTGLGIMPKPSHYT